MKRTIAACAGLALGMVALGAFAATKHPAGKGAQRAAGLRRADLPRGGFGRQRRRPAGRVLPVALRHAGAACRCQAAASQWTISCSPTASGSPPHRPRLPDWAANCAVEKKLPKPAAAGTSPCTGQRFRVVLAHDGSERLALLYGFDGSAWHYCSAGSY